MTSIRKNERKEIKSHLGLTNLLFSVCFSVLEILSMVYILSDLLRHPTLARCVFQSARGWLLSARSLVTSYHVRWLLADSGAASPSDVASPSSPLLLGVRYSAPVRPSCQISTAFIRDPSI